MYVDMRWEDENGRELAAVLSPPRSAFVNLVPGDGCQELQCLGRLSTYGDVLFPSLQIPQLVRELEGIVPHCQTDETRRHVMAMLEVVRKASKHIPSCIRFYGD